MKFESVSFAELGTPYSVRSTVFMTLHSYICSERAGSGHSWTYQALTAAYGNLAWVWLFRAHSMDGMADMMMMGDDAAKDAKPSTLETA